MCGIFCSVLKTGNEIRAEKPHNEYELSEDIHSLLYNRGPDCVNFCRVENVIFAGFVLWQQGVNITSQPVVKGHIILLFNGDLYNIDHLKPNTTSDSEWLCESLVKCNNDEEIMAVLYNLQGPYSLIIYNKHSKYLYFARDSMGRTSLLIENTIQELRILSSTSKCNKPCRTTEIPPIGLFKVNTYNEEEWLVLPWKNPDEYWVNQASNFEELLKVKLRISNNTIPKKENIYKISYNFYTLCSGISIGEELFKKLLEDQEVKLALNTFESCLELSVKNRVEKTPPFCKSCILTKQNCNHSKIAILFSGGIDCTILAVLVDRYANKDDSIDLINVSFERAGKENVDWDVPDRISAKKSLQELVELLPNRKWNFVEVNVYREELNKILDTHLKHLIYPLNTVLDESIGASFWFAARGVGKCNNVHWETQARVAIIGSGADELFGGYMRHRKAYIRCKDNEHEKNVSVDNELKLDIQRLPSRNLGRDDRVVGDTSKSLRAPYIEENIFQFVNSLKGFQRCCFSLPDGIGDKLFLRLYGYHIGLRFPVYLKKRAIQFGTKIASKTQKGSDISKHLM